jgi:hypothetical protein
MSGHRPFSELTKNFTPARRAHVAAKAAVLREVMTLEELRKAAAAWQTASKAKGPTDKQ